MPVSLVLVLGFFIGAALAYVVYNLLMLYLMLRALKRFRRRMREQWEAF